MNSSGERYQNGSTVVNLKWSAQKFDLTWVGIHVRRGDFLYLRQISSVHFITEAMNYFEKKYDNVIFLIASDDKTFCRKVYGNRSNVIITPASFSNGEDLAALFACNHMIVTVGTFGWWAGF
jgi:galactoside 2-L-fucosyltransferase 1/2